MPVPVVLLYEDVYPAFSAGVGLPLGVGGAEEYLFEEVRHATICDMRCDMRCDAMRCDAYAAAHMHALAFFSAS